MTWPEIRQKYVHSWILVEALDAFTRDGQRVIPDLRIVDAFDGDWKKAWTAYKEHHHADRDREYYVLHTDNEVLDIGVIDTFGRVLS